MPPSPPPSPLRLELDPRAAELERAQARLRSYFTADGVADTAMSRAEVVLEELFVNVLMHAGEAGRAEPVRLEAWVAEGRRPVLVFEAAGPAFDPRQEPARPSEAERARLDPDAPLGGLGLVLIQSLAERLDFERTDQGRNRTTVAVRVDAGEGR